MEPARSVAPCDRGEDTALAGVARAHPVAAIIEDATGQESIGFGPLALVAVYLPIERGLDRVE
jgi:hypothetical protein